MPVTLEPCAGRRERSCGSRPNHADSVRKPPSSRGDVGCSPDGNRAAQEPVHQVTRPIAAGMSVGLGERCVFAAQRQHLLPNNLLVHVDRGPFPEAAEPLGEGARLRGGIGLPDPPPDLPEQLLRCTARSRIFRNECRKQRISVTLWKSDRQAGLLKIRQPRARDFPPVSLRLSARSRVEASCPRPDRQFGAWIPEYCPAWP